jgi:hypothetical protein
LTQLKSDAQDLFDAIANAEAEMKAAMPATQRDLTSS